MTFGNLHYSGSTALSALAASLPAGQAGWFYVATSGGVPSAVASAASSITVSGAGVTPIGFIDAAGNVAVYYAPVAASVAPAATADMETVLQAVFPDYSITDNTYTVALVAQSLTQSWVFKYAVGRSGGSDGSDLPNGGAAIVISQVNTPCTALTANQGTQPCTGTSLADQTQWALNSSGGSLPVGSYISGYQYNGVGPDGTSSSAYSSWAALVAANPYATASPDPNLSTRAASYNDVTVLLSTDQTGIASLKADSVVQGGAYIPAADLRASSPDGNCSTTGPGGGSGAWPDSSGVCQTANYDGSAVDSPYTVVNGSLFGDGSGSGSGGSGSSGVPAPSSDVIAMVATGCSDPSNFNTCTTLVSGDGSTPDDWNANTAIDATQDVGPLAVGSYAVQFSTLSAQGVTDYQDWVANPPSDYATWAATVRSWTPSGSVVDFFDYLSWKGQQGYVTSFSSDFTAYSTTTLTVLPLAATGSHLSAPVRVDLLPAVMVGLGVACLLFGGWVGGVLLGRRRRLVRRLRPVRVCA